MFVPEKGDFFHVYSEEHGLLKNTVFLCVKTDSKLVVGEYAAGDKPEGVRSPTAFPRNLVSFWPVQPGFRQHLLGHQAPRDRTPADPVFVATFKQIAKIG